MPLLARVYGKPTTIPSSFPIEGGIVGRVVRNGRAEWVNDAQLDRDTLNPPGYASPAGGEHLLVAPLISGDQTLGAVVLRRCDDDRFDGQDFSLFEVLSAQAGVALQSSLLFDEERRRRHHATALVDVAAALNRAGTLQDIVRHLAAAAAAAVGVDRCSLYVYDESAERTLAADCFGRPGGDPDGLNGLPPAALPVERELLRTGQRLVGDALERLLLEQGSANTSHQHGGAALPLRVRGQVQGAMYVWSGIQPPRVFDADELALLEAIADHAGLAVERARLSAVSARRVAELRLLGEVNSAIARSLDRAEVVRGALASTRAVVPFLHAVVALDETRRGDLTVVEAWGPATQTMVGITLPLDGSVNGLVYSTDRPFTGRRGDGAAHYAPSGMALVGEYVVAVPLRTEQRVIGTLCLTRDDPGAFSTDDRDLLLLVAGQLAVGIERARIHAVALAERERSNRQAHSLAAVLDASHTLALQRDLESAIAAIGDGVDHLVPNAACAVFRADPERGDLVVVSSRGPNGNLFPDHRVALGAGITGEAALHRRPLVIANAERDQRMNADLLRAIGRGADRIPNLHAISVPFVVESELTGALTLYRVDQDPFTDEEFAAVQVYAGQAAAAVRGTELLARNRDLYVGGVRALAAAVDAKDPYTRGHSDRVSAVAGRIAVAMGFDRANTETVELAGLLHDIGKIGVPDAVLQKPGPLDNAERAVMMGHAAGGAAILAGADSEAMRPLVPLIRHHHEWLDGRGYPDGLAGDSIPLGSAILAVADAFDTIVTDRPYRRGRPVAAAMVELRRAAGTQFLPLVVDTLAALIDAGIVDAPAATVAEVAAPVAADAAPLAAGQMGDTRALGLLVELTEITRHIPNLTTFLDRVAAVVRGRLGYENVYLLLVNRDQNDLSVEAHAGDDTRLDDGYRQPLDVGVSGDVIRHRHLLNVPNVLNEKRYVAPWPNPMGSELIVPLLVEEEVIGLINVKSQRTAAFTSADEVVLTAVAGQVAAAIHVAQLHDTVKRAAATDGLTGVANHRAFYDALDEAVAAGNPLAVILLDVEGLKRVNDTVGHLAGDALLRRVAAALRDRVRAEDLVARYGGDEFAAIMRGIDAPAAERVAARVRRALLTATAPLHEPRATVRYGVAAFPADGLRPTDLVAAADRRLYEMRAHPPRVTHPRTRLVAD